MSVHWTLTTPMLLPPHFEQTEDGRLLVPGSSVKGAVRSLHETLMGGCLRILDADFVPVYREPSVSRSSEDWRLALVVAATREGRVLRVRVSDEDIVWVPVDHVRDALGRLPRTGDRIDIDEREIPQAPDGLGRREVNLASAIRSGGRWSIIVGDAGTRGKSQRFFVAAGYIGADDDAGYAVPSEPRADEYDVPPETWSEYERLCAGTNDLRLIRQNPNKDAFKDWRGGAVFSPVRWRGREVCFRRVVTGRLWPGDVVWARINQTADAADGGPAAKTVDRLSMAAIWRTPGAGAVRERIPEGLGPCQDHDALCVSCRVFGSAETAGVDPDRGAEHRGYAGHIRFGDAVATGPVELQTVKLAPLATPRPGAGQFYLRHNRETGLEPAEAEQELPAAAWGSRHDLESERPRRLAGRKYYWHGDPNVTLEGVEPRHVARKVNKLTSDRQLVPPGTEFSETIWFDNIAPAELASLLLTLMPSALLPVAERAAGRTEFEYRLHLGGGKPLGLGSCRVEVRDLVFWEAADRYRGGAAVATDDAAAYVERHRSQLAQLAGHEVRKHWPTLSRVLREDGVQAALLRYPLGGEWADSPDKRDGSYVFFAASQGKWLGRSDERIVPLPDPSQESNPQTIRYPLTNRTPKPVNSRRS